MSRRFGHRRRPKSGLALVCRALYTDAPLYVGAVGNRTNIGDSLLFEAHEQLLGRLAFLPMGGNDRLLRVRSLGHQSTRVILGGGTLIGRPSYRHALESAVSNDAGASLAMLGTGVSGPRPFGKSDLMELERWIRPLRWFPTVRVRGPRSAERLEDMGVPSSVVGDPVLSLLRTPRQTTPAVSTRSEESRRPFLGLNAASIPAKERVNHAMVEAVGLYTRFLGTTPEIRVLAASDYDMEAARDLCGDLMRHGHLSEIVCLSGLHSDKVKGIFQGYDKLVTVRLHISVIAAALDVPYVQLNYEDKCLDFEESIRPVGTSLDIAELSGALLFDRILELEGQTSLPRDVNEEIDRLVTLQRISAREVLRELDDS